MLTTPSLPLMMLLGAAAGLPAGAMMVLPSEVLRPRVRAAGMGVFFTWYYAGVALLTPVAGILRDASEAPGAPLLFATALELLAIAVLVLLRRLQSGSALILAAIDAAALTDRLPNRLLLIEPILDSRLYLANAIAAGLWLSPKQ